MQYNHLDAVMNVSPDEGACIKYLEQLRWAAGMVCPRCNSSRKVYNTGQIGHYKCADCKRTFSIRKGTIFEESRLPLHKWVAAAWLMTCHNREITSTQLAREIHVTQKTAWFMLGRFHKIGQAMSNFNDKAGGKTESTDTQMAFDQLLSAAVNALPPHPIEHWLNQIHHSDCIEVMDKMPAESVGMIVTSPPYNLRNSTGNGMKDGRGGKWENAKLIKGYATIGDDMPHDEYIKWQRACLTAMMRVLSNDGVIFYNHKWRVQGGVWQRLADEITAGFPVRQIIIWQRAGGINFNAGYFLPTYEVIYMICKPDFKLAPKANAQGDVWSIPQDKHNPHPASFPVELAQRCIQSTTAKIVLDPFMGSGSTAIAAETCKRDWIGIDISEDYCQLANERISAARKLL